MRGSRHPKLIRIGPISENVSLKVISVVAKLHAFIVNLNNSVFFWSITAGLIPPRIFFRYFAIISRAIMVMLERWSELNLCMLILTTEVVRKNLTRVLL